MARTKDTAGRRYFNASSALCLTGRLGWTMTASGRSFSIAENAASSSSALWIIIGSIAVPMAAPLKRICSRNGLENGSGALTSTATRCADGSKSRISSTHFACQCRTDGGHAGDIPTRPGEALDQSGCDRVSGEGHNDRDVARRLLRGEGGRREPGHDQIDLEPHQFCRPFGEAVSLPRVRAELEPDAFPLDVTQVAQVLLKQPPEPFRAGRTDDQDADGRHFRLLRPRREGPEGRRAGDDCEKVAPLHSMTSSARAMSRTWSGTRMCGMGPPGRGATAFEKRQRRMEDNIPLPFGLPAAALR